MRKLDFFQHELPAECEHAYGLAIFPGVASIRTWQNERGDPEYDRHETPNITVIDRAPESTGSLIDVTRSFACAFTTNEHLYKHYVKESARAHSFIVS